MKILLTNDDGINAPGINILADYLIARNHQVTVVAPDVEKSASSHSITLQTPLRIIQETADRYAVTGSPADSVILALQVIITERCDIVISGVNRGPNLGEDILYSGTVAAAIEAMYFGLPAIAVSLCSKTLNHFKTAAEYISNMLDSDINSCIGENEILNVNVPAVPPGLIKGIKVTKAGNRIYQNFVTEQKDPRGRKIYWLGGDKPQWVDEEDSDIKAIENNFISVTPISPTFTNFGSIKKVQTWANHFNGMQEK